MIQAPISQTASPAPGAGSQPSPQMAPDQSQGHGQGQQDQPPVEFDIHIKAQPDELEAAIAVLKESGMDDLASALEKALKGPGDATADESKQLQDEIVAMGNNPHSGMGA